MSSLDTSTSKSGAKGPAKNDSLGSARGLRDTVSVVAPQATCLSNVAFSLWLPPHGIQSFTAKLHNVDLPEALSSDDRAQYLAALRDEHTFLRRNKAHHELPELPSTLAESQRFFQDQHFGKLGLRHIAIESDSATAQWGIIPYPAYRLFSSRKGEEFAHFSATVGASVLITTADDKLIMQHRSDKNDLYKGTLAVSAAGLVNAPSRGSDTTLDVLRHARACVLKEQREEIGLASPSSSALETSGIILGHQTVHHEIPFFVSTEQTSTQMLENVRRNSFKDSPVSFRENAFAVPNRPEVIEALLTDCFCPVPDTHAAMLLMKGFEIMSRLHPATEAHRWVGRVVDEMQEQIARIDARCGGRYDPSQSLQAQRLPTLQEELVRLYGRDGFEYAEKHNDW
jgi:hypothetical protein